MAKNQSKNRRDRRKRGKWAGKDLWIAGIIITIFIVGVVLAVVFGTDIGHTHDENCGHNH